MTSFDEKLESLFYQQKSKNNSTKIICPEGSQEFNHKLGIAQQSLNVSWISSYKDINLATAITKSTHITCLRDAMEVMSKQMCSDPEPSFDHTAIKESFMQIVKAFQLPVERRMDAYQLLLQCLLPLKIDSLGQGSEMFHTSITYRKLLQISALYGFRMDLNISIKNLVDPTKSSFSKEVVKLLKSDIKPDCVSGVQLRDNASLPYSRVKFIEEDKVDINHAHPDFLKVVAIMRLFHSLLLYKMKPSSDNLEQISNLATYGLLTEKNHVRLLGIHVCASSLKSAHYKYELFNVGTFPLNPYDESENQNFDILISFMLEASRQTFEENSLINEMTNDSLGKKRSTSLPYSEKEFVVDDILDFLLMDDEKMIVTIKKYREDLSTPSEKEIFEGIVHPSNQPVMIKIFTKEGLISLPPNQNAFLRIRKAFKDDKFCKKKIEVSIKGNVLDIKKQRAPTDIIHIMTQLLLEIAQIHEKAIHNDIKPYNIIIIGEQEHQTKSTPSYYCKYIDFEFCKLFSEEDGDCCTFNGDTVFSTSGTEGYFAPEKEKGGDEKIHPKTDIYSLGLVFIELILGQYCNNLSGWSLQSWEALKRKCIGLDLHLGPLIYKMITQMIIKERRKRLTARECLQLIEKSNEKVDDRKYSILFCPPKANATIESSCVDNFSPQLINTKNDTNPCCKCTTDNCANCVCSKNKNGCYKTCKSPNCTKKRKSSPTNCVPEFKHVKQ